MNVYTDPTLPDMAGATEMLPGLERDRTERQMVASAALTAPQVAT